MRTLPLTAAVAALTLAACGEAPSGPGALAPDGPSLAVAAANANGNKLQCFQGSGDGYGSNGTCTVDKAGTVHINTVDGDANPYNNYAGVYLQNSNLDGKRLADVNRLAFSYDGSGAVGGSPRLTVPIDTDGDGTTDAYLFIDTVNCNDGDPNVGTLDAINDATCTMYLNNVGYDNWAALVAANPTYRVATDEVSFVIVDQEGTFTITNVQLGKGPAGGAKP